MAVKKSGTHSRKSSGASRSSGAKKGGSKGRSTSAGSASSGSSSSEMSLSGVLDKLGTDKVVDVWRDRVSGPVGKQVDKIDLSEALEKAREYASMSGAALKKAGGKNPKMFYSGLAAILVGAGLIASARGGKMSRAEAGAKGGRKSPPPTKAAAAKGGRKSRPGSKKSGRKGSSSSGSQGGSSGTTGNE